MVYSPNTSMQNSLYLYNVNECLYFFPTVEHAWDTMTMAIQVGTIFIDHSLMPLLLLPRTYKLEFIRRLVDQVFVQSVGEMLCLKLLPQFSTYLDGTCYT